MSVRNTWSRALAWMGWQGRAKPPLALRWRCSSESGEGVLGHRHGMPRSNMQVTEARSP